MVNSEFLVLLFSDIERTTATVARKTILFATFLLCIKEQYNETKLNFMAKIELITKFQIKMLVSWLLFVWSVGHPKVVDYSR
jgi:EamA domain-containing membrane protein RarD